MIKKVFLLTMLLILGTAASLFAITGAESGQFEKANLAYRDGDFEEAAALYQSLAEKYPKQAVFAYNLGNALHREGKLGAAILAYEKALSVDPRNLDIRSNLTYVRTLTEYKIEDKRNEVIRMGEKVLSYVAFRELELVALTGLFVFFFSWAVALFFKRELTWGWTRKVFFWIAITGLSLAVLKTVQMHFFREAIVLVKNAQVYYGPSVNDQQAFKLGEGLKVYVRDRRESWSRILIASGETGWLQNELMGEVNASL